MGSTMFKVGLVALYLQGTTAAAVDGILEQHNAYRCMHSADPLTYNINLEADAQVWADELVTENCGTLAHDPSLNDIGQGENLAYCRGAPEASVECSSGSDATPRWYQEVDFYVPGPSGGTSDPAVAIGHFTQIVWKDTEELGCASATCELPYIGDIEFLQGQNWQYTYVVCRYSPPGNFQGQYLEQVQGEPTPGTSVDSCEAAGTCTADTDCDMASGEICCPLTNVCEVQGAAAGACGDPHMTGFRGQKFDFTGEDGAWYSVFSDLPSMHLNMRVTSPVPSVPEITYITGISIMATDDDGLDHTIVIQVTDPHSLESSCPVGMSPCLAEGALSVELNGEEALVAPGAVTLGPGVAISAVNLPGACRSFGFEKYWERKKAENAKAGRKLRSIERMKDMGDWILADPTATNLVECGEYVAKATAANEAGGLFAHDSEHASFQIMTPVATIRLSHGRLHQLPMRDPTDQFDLPDHLTWQMNLAIDHNDMSLEATGILGETLVPVVDDNGKPVMEGMESIRGTPLDYLVEGPLDVIFAQGHHE